MGAGNQTNQLSLCSGDPGQWWMVTPVLMWPSHTGEWPQVCRYIIRGTPRPPGRRREVWWSDKPGAECRAPVVSPLCHDIVTRRGCHVWHCVMAMGCVSTHCACLPPYCILPHSSFHSDVTSRETRSEGLVLVGHPVLTSTPFHHSTHQLNTAHTLHSQPQPSSACSRLNPVLQRREKQNIC